MTVLFITREARKLSSSFVSFSGVMGMIAVIQTGGKQYKVSEGDEIQVEKLDGNVGESVNLDKVLICGEGESAKVGTPFLEGCSVVCEVTEQYRDKKIIVFKKHRRKNYRRKNGHRQSLTRLKVTAINA
jgi:large subunit ribosomal protein L21|tara:strand:- start:1944 stop:2330 length:387 start_codon:yes stop_codon:yes gene_type:complete